MVDENKDSNPHETQSDAHTKAESASTKKSVSVKNNKKASKATKKKVGVNHAKSVSSQTNTESDFPWKIIAIVLGVIMVILLAIVLVMKFSNTNSEDSNLASTNTTKNSNSINSSSSEVIDLTVIEDSTCTTCQVDLFTSQVKSNLMPTLEVKKVSITSSEGKAALSSLKATQVPIYLFSTNIDKRDDWATNLAGAFEKVSVSGKDYYMLNPQFVQNKVMLEEPKVTSTAIVYGNPNAKVTIYEFSDYECPFCGIAEGNAELVAQFSAQSPGYVPTMPNVYKDYIDTGKVKLVFYNFPLTSIHKNAMGASIATLCANEQGKWREFHDVLFEKRSVWVSSTDLKASFDGFAKDLNLDVTKFDTCYASNKYDSQIQSEIDMGVSYGVSGTPAFFVGKNFVSGAQDYNTMKSIIDAELAK